MLVSSMSSDHCRMHDSDQTLHLCHLAHALEDDGPHGGSIRSHCRIVDGCDVLRRIRKQYKSIYASKECWDERKSLGYIP